MAEVKEQDVSLLARWCEQQAELEGIESWMCARAGSRQQWEGAAALYEHFAKVWESDQATIDQLEAWLVGARGAAERIRERIEEPIHPGKPTDA